MCLAVPGKVLSVEGDDPAFRSARVDFCGVRKTVSLAFTPEVQPGDFVLVHVGFALNRIDEEQAAQTYQYLLQIGALSAEDLSGEDLAPDVYPLPRGGGTFT
jgi:hydrogenase expression/formation protein HypC